MDQKSKGSGKKIRKLYHLDNKDVHLACEYARLERNFVNPEVIRLSVQKLQNNSGVGPFL